MESACDLEIKVEVQEYELPDMNSSLQDVNNMLSNIKTEEDDMEFLSTGSTSNNLDQTTFKNFVDVSETKTECELNVLTIKIEPTSSYNFEDATCVRADAEVESDPLAVDNSTIKLRPIKNTITPKGELSGWKSYPWYCNLCKRWPFPGYESLHEHIQTEHNETPMKNISYRCHDCDITYTCYSVFLNHVRLYHHTDWKFFCDICDMRFQDYNDLSSHRLIHTEMQKVVHPIAYLCFKCGRAYPKKNALNNHIQLSHSNKCYICKKVYASKLELKAHFQLLHNFVCDTCGLEFVSHNYLNEHKRMHKELRLRCEFCRDIFNSVESLDKHTKGHYLPVKFKCNYCKKEFSRKVEKEKHERLHKEEESEEDEEEKEQKYSQCSTQGAPMKYDLEFKCDFCEMEFSTKAEKLYHEQMHSKNENQYDCAFCGETFETPQNLKLHTKNHFAPVKFKCGYCEKEFSKRAQKIKHERIHVEKHNCVDCKVCFASTQELEEHCKKCPKTIAVRYQYQCKFCLRSYKFLCSLNRHISNHHNGHKKDKISKKKLKENSVPELNNRLQ